MDVVSINEIDNSEQNKELNNVKKSINEDLKNNLLINNLPDYKLNLFHIITKVSSSKNVVSKTKENEFILNLILMSSKLNKSNKLICLLLLFYLNQNEKKNLNLLTNLFTEICKLAVKQENIPNIENYISINDPSFIVNENNLFYSKKNIHALKIMISNKNCDLHYITTIENLLKDINKNIKAYLNERRNEFLNKTIMDDNHLTQLKNIIYQLCDNKIEISENSQVYIINKKWVFRTKLFLDTYSEARKENIEKLLLEESFFVDKVYEYFMRKADDTKLKNYYGIVFPGPINNYDLLDLRDNWVDPSESNENYIIKDNLILNEDYFYLEENDWNYIKDIFGATNEIKRKNKEQNFYKNKIIIFESRLGSHENKHLLKKKIMQIDSNLTVKDFKNKIIRCLNYDIDNNIKNYINEEMYEENDVKFFAVDKRNKDILIEMCISFINHNKFYGSLYIKNIENNNKDIIKNIFNNYDSDYYFLIAEVIPKKNPRAFIQQIDPDINNSNIYNCSVCGEQLNLLEKYNCDLCNLSLFCSNECANISGEHKILHKFLNEIYIKKFNIKQFLEEKMKTKKDSLNGVVGLSKDKNYSCINSIIHCLSNNIDFTKYFLNNTYTNDINISDFLTVKDSLVNKYNSLIMDMWMGEKVNKKLENCHKDLVLLIIKKMKIDSSSNASMNNIHEILIFLLAEFHKELNRYINNEKINKKELEGNTTDSGIEAYAKKDNSIITDLFQGIYQSILSCSRCGNVSMVYDFFKYILLPMPKKNNNLLIKYFNEFECKEMRFVMEDSSTIRDLKDKSIANISDKINHILHIMSLTELIEVTAFENVGNDDEKILTYTAMYNSIELVQFDKNKIITKIYSTEIKPESNDNIKKEENNNDFNLQLSRIYKENNDAELVFYERSVIDKGCINIYIYPFMYNDKEKFNKNKDKLFNVYPIAISVKPTIIIENFIYLVNVRIRDLLLEHFKEESEKREMNYIELVYPHFFYNCNYHSQTNCFLCKERKKNSLFCPLLSAIDKDQTVQDLMNLFEYPKQPIFFLGKCKYYDLKKQYYSNMNSFPSEISTKKTTENKLDIYDCFELYTKKETISDMEWFCEACNNNQIPQKQLLIYKPPLYLIIQFDRFQVRKSISLWNNYGFDDSLISFPINNFDIGPYVEGPEKNKAKYNLFGAIYREVSARSDSIYSVCKNNKKWIMFKDTKVQGTNAIVTKYAHFLFYKRQDLPN